MAADRDHRKLSRYEIATGILVIGLTFPALAAANHRELPAAYTTISSISLVEVDEQTVAFEFADDLLTLNSARVREGLFLGLRLSNLLDRLRGNRGARAGSRTVADGSASRPAA